MLTVQFKPNDVKWLRCSVGKSTGLGKDISVTEWVKKETGKTNSSNAGHLWFPPCDPSCFGNSINSAPPAQKCCWCCNYIINSLIVCWIGLIVVMKYFSKYLIIIWCENCIPHVVRVLNCLIMYINNNTISDKCMEYASKYCLNITFLLVWDTHIIVTFCQMSDHSTI